MSWKVPTGRIVHNTNEGRTVNADLHKFTDEILTAANTGEPQYYRTRSGKTICLNRFSYTERLTIKSQEGNLKFFKISFWKKNIKNCMTKRAFLRRSKKREYKEKGKY